MKYEQAIKQLEEKGYFGTHSGIVISEQMLAAMGNPQKNLPFIHVAGTNGKGSVTAFLCEILTKAGYKTGMYTSPHLEEFTERIRIGGEMISKERFAKLAESLLEQDFAIEGTISDYCLLMAVRYFIEEKCDLAIFETGLGGTFDSTNALGIPMVSIITKIGYDHTAVLGETLGEIATQKAGILKKGSYAVLESQSAEAENVLIKHCNKKEIPYFLLDADKITGNNTSFAYDEKERYSIQMFGMHQRENALAAVFAARHLQTLGYCISDEQIQSALFHTKWQGRMELLSEKPFFMIDGAHNSNGVRALAKSLRELYPKERFCFFMGVLADKDYKEMVDEILPIADKMIAFTPEHTRALQANDLAEYIKSRGGVVEIRTNIQDIVQEIFATQQDAVLQTRYVAFGSLHFVGTIRKMYFKYQKEKELSVNNE